MRLRPELGLLVVAALAGGVLAVAPATQAAKPFPGCRPDSPTVMHRAGGAVLKTNKPARIPCGSDTGYYTGETGIAVHPNGDVWFSAADWEWAMVRTKDKGRTWQREAAGGPQAQPGCFVATSPATCMDSQSAKNGSVADAFLHIDSKTGRLFWSKTYGFAVCSSLSITPDNGKTWKSVSMFACPGADYEKIASGPAPAGGEQPVGYPNVVYGCTNGPAPWFVVGPGRYCTKSLDGGLTWKPAGMPLPSPLAPGCLHFQEPQQVGPKGTLFLPISCGNNNPAGTVRIGVSHDEGATWTYPTVPTGEVGNGVALIGGVSMAVDKANTVYVVWRGANQKVYLAVSKDEGLTWKGPMMVSMPGVTAALVTPQVTAQAPGHIAIGYYGFTGTDSRRLNGYLTESFNANAASPVLHSAAVNDPKKPLYFATNGGTLPRNDYMGVAFGPDGTPWAAYVKLLSKNPDREGFVQSTGFAGRLARS